MENLDDRRCKIPTTTGPRSSTVDYELFCGYMSLVVTTAVNLQHNQPYRSIGVKLAPEREMQQGHLPQGQHGDLTQRPPNFTPPSGPSSLVPSMRSAFHPVPSTFGNQNNSSSPEVRGGQAKTPESLLFDSRENNVETSDVETLDTSLANSSSVSIQDNVLPGFVTGVDQGQNDKEYSVPRVSTSQSMEDIGTVVPSQAGHFYITDDLCAGAPVQGQKDKENSVPQFPTSAGSVDPATARAGVSLSSPENSRPLRPRPRYPSKKSANSGATFLNRYGRVKMFPPKRALRLRHFNIQAASASNRSIRDSVPNTTNFAASTSRAQPGTSNAQLGTLSLQFGTISAQLGTSHAQPGIINSSSRTTPYHSSTGCNSDNSEHIWPEYVDLTTDEETFITISDDEDAACSNVTHRESHTTYSGVQTRRSKRCRTQQGLRQAHVINCNSIQGVAMSRPTRRCTLRARTSQGRSAGDITPAAATATCTSSGSPPDAESRAADPTYVPGSVVRGKVRRNTRRSRPTRRCTRRADHEPLTGNPMATQTTCTSSCDPRGAEPADDTEATVRRVPRKPTRGVMRCRTCGQISPNVHHWVKHAEVHKEFCSVSGRRKEFRCPDCPTFYDDVTRLRNHRALKHGDSQLSVADLSINYSCVVCGGGFHSETELMRHYNLHDEMGSDGRRKKNKCEKCGFYFRDKVQLRSHFWTHHRHEQI